MSVKSKFKIITAAILAVLPVIVIFQNTESVQTKLLFATIEMPRAAVLFLSMAIGFIIGLLVAYSFARKAKTD